MAKKMPAKVKGARKPSANKLALLEAEASAQAEKETKSYMNELIQAATEFFKAGTAYFSKMNGGAAAVANNVAAPAAPAKEEAATATAAVEAAPKRTRRTKEQIAADEAAADPLGALGLPSEPVAPAPKPLTDKESYDLLLKTAGEYVAHFTKEVGIPKAKAHLAPYKVASGKITDLTHEQRLPFIKTLQAELDAAKKA